MGSENYRPWSTRDTELVGPAENEILEIYWEERGVVNDNGDDYWSEFLW